VAGLDAPVFCNGHSQGTFSERIGQFDFRFGRGIGGLVSLDVFGGEAGELGDAGQVQFFFNSSAIIIDCFDAEAEVAGDFVRTAPLGDQSEHLFFPVAELIDGEGIGIGAFFDLIEHQRLHETRTHIDFPLKHLMDGFDELENFMIFGDISPSSGSKNRAGIERFFMHAQHHDGNFRLLGLQSSNQIKTVSFFEGNVGDHEVGICFSDPGQGCGRILRFPDDLQIRLAVDQMTEALPEDGMIIHQEDAHAPVFSIGSILHKKYVYLGG
jgi:hypothetical protein